MTTNAHQITFADWTDDQLLDYWDDPKNHEAIINAVPLDDLSEVDVICDNYEVDREFITQVLNAVPKNLNFNFQFEKSDMNQMQSLVKEKKIQELERYFIDFMKDHPSSVKKDHTSSVETATGSTDKKDRLPSDKKVCPPSVETATGKQDEIKKLMLRIQKTQFIHQDDVPNVLPTVPSDFVQASSSDATKALPFRPSLDWADYFSSLPQLPVNPMKPVPESKLTEDPYRSVGKLIWYRTDYTKFHWGTAFYVGKNMIVTVAHNIVKPLMKFPICVLQKYLRLFPRRPIRKAMFIPAMKDYEDTDGELYGHYTISDVKVHPLYQPGKDEYDICSAKLGRGRQNGRQLNGFRPDPNAASDLMSLPLQPIEPLKPHASRVYQVIGYPYGKNGDMWELDGIEINNTDRENNDKIISIYTKSPVQPGISGGPWIYDNTIHGIQVGVGVVRNLESKSPILSLELLKNISLE